MRVTGTVVTLIVMLLALCVFTPAAGAIFIEGQSIPDDGMMHILAAGGESSVPAADPAVAGDLPAGSQTDTPYTGLLRMSRGFPSMLTTNTLPAMTSFEETLLGPDTTAMFTEGVAAGDVIGHTMSPSVAGYWNFFDAGSFQTNIPELKSLFA